MIPGQHCLRPMLHAEADARLIVLSRACRCLSFVCVGETKTELVLRRIAGGGGGVPIAVIRPQD